MIALTLLLFKKKKMYRIDYLLTLTHVAKNTCYSWHFKWFLIVLSESALE